MLSLFIYVPDEKIFALANDELRIISMENGKEVLKFVDDVVCYLISQQILMFHLYSQSFGHFGFFVIAGSSAVPIYI